MHKTDSARESFHSRFNRILAVVAWVLTAFALVTSAVAGLLVDLSAARIVLPLALIALAAYAVLWRPHLTVDDDAVTAVNVLRTVVIPWSALIDVDTKFSLTLRTPRGSYGVWAAPAPGRTGIAVARRAERRHGTESQTAALGNRSRPGDLITTESGEAAYLVRERWNELVESGRVEAGIAETVAVQVRWHWALDAGMALLLIATVVTAAMG
ncbi:PH domain-containing protein [Lacisediminihabitans changchengi]|uniref:PH domain-containing protein n=1 Tax=Lacisediminihabitans changchengi TaxID=2787634 RepID=A0A934SL36_9MICO|nr:PH domain-containing protein [Lacisediminihabitans changchengi]MBK4347321.1 PH domain-containing protein [Lacisediminihabitans changchengi]